MFRSRISIAALASASAMAVFAGAFASPARIGRAAHANVPTPQRKYRTVRGVKKARGKALALANFRRIEIEGVPLKFMHAHARRREIARRAALELAAA